MKKDLFHVWLYIAAAAAMYYLFHRMMEKKKYYESMQGLGFGTRILDLLSFRELQDVYTYIFKYTQKGKMPEIGSSLDMRLVEIGKKYPELIKYT
jgi:hypothetical protein